MPEGPQTAVETSVITEGLWVECDKQTLNTKMDEERIASIESSCLRNKVMMGCKKITSSTLDVLAWAPRDDVFGVTGTSDCGTGGSAGYTYRWYRFRSCTESETRYAVCDERACQRGRCDNHGEIDQFCNSVDYSIPNCLTCTCNDGGTCAGKTSNGVKWYRTHKAWGFADEGSTVNLYWVDVASGSNDKRLSLHVNDNDLSFVGAHRCGNTAASYNSVTGNGFDDNGSWELVFYHAD